MLSIPECGKSGSELCGLGGNRCDKGRGHWDEWPGADDGQIWFGIPTACDDQNNRNHNQELNKGEAILTSRG